MPTPLDIFINPAALTCLAIYAALMAWEYLFPARKLPVVAYWQLRGLTAFVVYFLLASYLPLLWDATLAQYSLLSLGSQPVWLQAVAAVLMYEFILYWWHRAMHSSNWLWRSFHQFHHSAERLDTYGAFWFSPLDTVAFTFASSLSLTLILGVSAEAAVLTLYATFFLSVFQHANIRTPQWVGYFLQRPESHSHHHGCGIHRDNYSDLPVFDLLFGTFRNPATHQENGFYQGASSRVSEMLLWQDVSSPDRKRGNAAQNTESVNAA
jgi:sterol desaturase/sphingolipid hydroxylase (fatty acid hydroxylase superfamily)